jgi:hypothetical protein
MTPGEELCDKGDRISTEVELTDLKAVHVYCDASGRRQQSGE